MIEPCPRIEGLSAYVDRALPASERAGLEAHLGECPVCGAALDELEALRTTFLALPEERLPFDMGALVLGRLPSPGPARDGRPRPLCRLAPLSLGAAAALAAGIYLGLLAIGAAGVAPQRSAAMAVFDLVPPGALCAGDPACFGRTR